MDYFYLFISAAVGFVFLVLFIIIFILYFKLYKKYKIFMSQSSGEKNIEELLIDYNHNIKEINIYNENLNSRIIKLEENIIKCYQKIGVKRYNAFPDMGNEMSYSIALLDDNNNGVIFTSIFTREYSQSYAKPVINGKTDRKLSEEEAIALKNAMYGL